MKKLLDVTDRKTRMLQAICMAACSGLAGLGFVMFRAGAVPPALSVLIMGSALVLLVFAAGIRQRWEIEYRGHRIRFENSPVFAERLFLDEGLVARGGLGLKMELRALIRVGEGAGEEITALVDAGLRTFRLRIFVEKEETDQKQVARGIPPAPAAPTYDSPIQELRPVTQSTVLGRIVVAKHILEFIATLIAAIGALTAAVAWFF